MEALIKAQNELIEKVLATLKEEAHIIAELREMGGKE